MDDDDTIIRETTLTYPQNRRISIITYKEDIGATRTYNEGLAKASGRYCTYVVGDDMPHPHMIEEMVAVLNEKEVDFVYSDMNVVMMPTASFVRCGCRIMIFKNVLPNGFTWGAASYTAPNYMKELG